MNDNYYLIDLINSLKKDAVMERYYPLIDYKDDFSNILNKVGVVRKSQMTEEVLEEISNKLGKDISNCFDRYIHIYDFNKTKLKDIKDYEGTKEYDELASLLRLPGVRLLRAKLYYNSGVTLKALSLRTTDEIRAMVGDYIKRENRDEIIPLPKEVNCHREVAKMILHTNDD